MNPNCTTRIEAYHKKHHIFNVLACPTSIDENNRIQQMDVKQILDVKDPETVTSFHF